MKDQRQALRTVLERHGINPTNVAHDGLDAVGYNGFVIDPTTGTRAINASGGAVHVRHDWPAGVLNDPGFRPALDEALAYLARVDALPIPEEES